MNVNDYVKLLKTNKNLVLTGAPGTGKTFLARQIAASMVLDKVVNDLSELTPEEKEKVKKQTSLVQFHPSYDYTDFVEGLRPVSPKDKETKDGEIKFERKDGVFKEFCKDALSSPIVQVPQPAEESSLLADDNIVREIYNSILERIRDGEK